MEVRPLLILLVEDAEENRFFIQKYLKEAPYTIDIAENGRIAVEKYISGKYDLILMDIQMPIMDGYMATRKIREWEKEHARSSVPIIALTAYTLKENMQKCLDAGCNDYVSKPVTKENLLRVILKHSEISET